MGVQLCDHLLGAVRVRKHTYKYNAIAPYSREATFVMVTVRQLAGQE